MKSPYTSARLSGQCKGFYIFFCFLLLQHTVSFCSESAELDTQQWCCAYRTSIAYTEQSLPYCANAMQLVLSSSVSFMLVYQTSARLP